MKNLRIDIVSDVMCPWCVIGYNNLKQALELLKTQSNDDINSEIHWLPFELNPNMPQQGQNLAEHLQEKYGSTPEQSQEVRERISSLGEELGFVFNFHNDMKIYNTFNAHQLLHWAGTISASAQTEFKQALFSAYFTDGQDVSNKEILLSVVEKVSLDREQAEKIINSQTHAEEVRALQSQWHQVGINSVPTFIFNQKYMVSGGQPAENFVNILKDIIAE